MADMNRINALPGETLLEILKFLPAKEAAKATILSSQWNHIWDDVYALEFNFADFWSEDIFNGAHNFVRINDRSECHENFVRVIDTVLASRQTQQKPIDRFTLVWQHQVKPYNHQEHPVTRWVDQVLERSPKVLSVYVQPDFALIEVPHRTFTCPTLEDMKLQLDSIRPGVPQTESVHLPSLRRLNLGYYTIKADFMAKLLPGCPNLKKLVLHACRLKLSHMSFSSLTSLFIDGSCNSTDIRVSIPSLQYLKITVLSCQTAEIVFEHMPSLAEACVCFLTAGDFPRSFYNRKASILNSLSGVKNLDVVLHGSEAQGMMKHALKDCPQFRNLKVLHFECFDVCLLGCVDIIGWLREHSEKLTDLSFYQHKDGSDKTNIMEQLRVIFDDIKLMKKLEMAECKKARIYESLDKLLEELTVYLRRFVKMEIEILEEKEAEVGLLGEGEEEEM